MQAASRFQELVKIILRLLDSVLHLKQEVGHVFKELFLCDWARDCIRKERFFSLKLEEIWDNAIVKQRLKVLEDEKWAKEKQQKVTYETHFHFKKVHSTYMTFWTTEKAERRATNKVGKWGATENSQETLKKSLK